MEDFNDQHKHDRQIHEIHVIFDNPLDIIDNTKMKEAEKIIEQVVKKIKATIRDINRTPTA